MDLYIDDMDEHLDGTLQNMREYLERLYMIYNGKLKKMNRKLEEIQQKIKELENFTNSDPIFEVLEKDVAIFKDFSDVLCKDMEELGGKIEIQSKINIKLYDIKQSKDEYLRKQNRNVVRLTDLITKVKTEIKQIKHFTHTDSSSSIAGREIEVQENSGTLNLTEKDSLVVQSYQ